MILIGIIPECSGVLVTNQETRMVETMMKPAIVEVVKEVTIVVETKINLPITEVTIQEKEIVEVAKGTKNVA
jgi:hypothetical protein